MFLLHAGEHSSPDFFTEIFLHGILDTLKIIPFLFLTYLLMEFIEHRADGRLRSFIAGSGRLGPLAGGLLGAVPQCGFSSVAANLYTGRVVTMGTLIAVFLSTSDEMLPILISGSFSAKAIIGILLYKVAVGMLVGFTVDLVLHLTKHRRQEINIDELCENDGCSCERGILRSALHHTLSISLFILLITWLMNALVFFVGEDALASVLYDKPVLSHIISALVGLIPSCAVSVALTGFFADGFITLGTMLSGLFSGAGVGVLILFRLNRHIKENLAIVAILVLSGFGFGLLADAMGLGAFLLG